MNQDPSNAFKSNELKAYNQPDNKDPILGGELKTKAVWVDENTCIGCTYCNSVATNTFGMESINGRARAFRQDGDSTEIIQEAIETCPVNCIHWVDFEELSRLKIYLEEVGIQSLGLPPKLNKKRYNN